MLFRLK